MMHHRTLVLMRDEFHLAIQRAVDLYKDGKLNPNPFYARDSLIDADLVEGIVDYLESEYEYEIGKYQKYHRESHGLALKPEVNAKHNEDPIDGITLVPPRLVDWPAPQKRALVQMIDEVNLRMREASKREFEIDAENADIRIREAAEALAREETRRAALTPEEREEEDRRRREYAAVEDDYYY